MDEKNKILFKLLKSLNLPVYENVYQGEDKDIENPFILFNLETDKVDFSAFDTPIAFLVSYQIHLYCPLEFNYHNVVKQIRRILFENGFSYPSIDNILLDKTNAELTVENLRHIVLSTEINYN